MGASELIVEIKESYSNNVKIYIDQEDFAMAAGEMNVLNIVYFSEYKQVLTPYTNGFTMVVEGKILKDILSKQNQTKEGCAEAVKTFEMYLNQLDLAIKSGHKHKNRRKK